MSKITVVKGCWITNIGNAFLDLGSIAMLQSALPNAQIQTTGSFPRWLFYAQNQGRFKFGKDIGLNSFSLISHIEADYAVFSGMVISVGFIERYGEDILKLKAKGTKIIINGGGASQYTDEEVKVYRNFLKKVKPYCLVARDTYSFDKYSDLAEHAYNGIDCGFFVNNYFPAGPLDIDEYDVHNFDGTDKPEVSDVANNLIITHHSPGLKQPKCYLEETNTMISDQPFDYLYLYANARHVHSDRVHACVVSLSYGNKCRLYASTQRGMLFEKVGISREDIRSKLVAVDMDKLQEGKQKQIAFLASILKG